MPTIFLRSHSPCEELAHIAFGALAEGFTPLVLGGDHSIAVGSVAAAATHFHQSGRKIGLIWIDAHADMNTPKTSPSGNVHGMPLACCLGLGPSALVDLGGFSPKVYAANAVIVGVREIDELERESIRSKLASAPSRCARSTSAVCAP